VKSERASEYITCKKKASYTTEFKLKVILYADENGKLSAAQQLDVDPKYVHTRCYHKELSFQKEHYMAIQ
jgi:hypothetical protein